MGWIENQEFELLLLNDINGFWKFWNSKNLNFIKLKQTLIESEWKQRRVKINSKVWINHPNYKICQKNLLKLHKIKIKVTLKSVKKYLLQIRPSLNPKEPFLTLNPFPKSTSFIFIRNKIIKMKLNLHQRASSHIPQSVNAEPEK